MRWHVLRDLMLLFLGVCMVLVLARVNAELHTISDRLLENRVATCRMTKKLGVPLDPKGPCSVPEVQKRLEELSLAGL